MSLVADSPKFHDKVLQVVAGNWQLTGLLTAQTGGYWTVTSGKDNSLTGVNLDRPNVVGDWRVSNPTPTLWFNPAAFVANGPGQYGDSGQGVILGPGLFDVDMGLMRFVQVRERKRIEFRAEAFNLLNHANFATARLDAFVIDRCSYGTDYAGRRSPHSAVCIILSSCSKGVLARPGRRFTPRLFLDSGRAIEIVLQVTVDVPKHLVDARILFAIGLVRLETSV